METRLRGNAHDFSSLLYSSTLQHLCTVVLSSMVWGCVGV